MLPLHGSVRSGNNTVLYFHGADPGGQREIGSCAAVLRRKCLAVRENDNGKGIDGGIKCRIKKTGDGPSFFISAFRLPEINAQRTVISHEPPPAMQMEVAEV